MRSLVQITIRSLVQVYTEHESHVRAPQTQETLGQNRPHSILQNLSVFYTLLMLSAAEHNPNMSTYMRAKALYFPYKYEKIVFLENSNIIKSLKVKSMNQLKKKLQVGTQMGTEHHKGNSQLSRLIPSLFSLTILILGGKASSYLACICSLVSSLLSHF